MTEWKTETHATTTVERNADNSIRCVKCQAECYEVGETEDGLEDEYGEGVSAIFRFDIVDGDTAVLEGVKGIKDGCPAGYDTSLNFVRAIPAAEQAVGRVPGIDEVQNIEDDLYMEFDRGARARDGDE